MVVPAVLFALVLALGVAGWVLRRHKAWAAICINLAAVVLALGAFEVYRNYSVSYGDGTRLSGSIVWGFTHRDDILGYVPDANARVTAKKQYGDSVIYNVTYTVDRNGLRVTAPASASADECVIFFGDSFTFGEGLEDNENFAYLVSEKIAKRYKTYNFGYSGYGPHQMLANLQSGRVEKIVRCTPKYFYYLCLLDHSERVAGLDDWDKHGPRFALRPDGSVIQQGHFDDPDPSADADEAGWLGRLLAGSRIWQYFFGREQKARAEDVPLLIGVINQSARITRERFPGSVFNVILWDGVDKEKTDTIANGLIAGGVHVIPMTSIVKGYYDHWRDYVLSEYDRHPNAAFDRELADFIVDQVLHDGAVQSKPAARP